MLIYGMGNIGDGGGSSGGTVTPPVVSVSAIMLSPSTGTANSAAGTIVGTLSPTVSNGPLSSPVWTLLNSAGGDFQIINGNQVAFLPKNVPAGIYSITAQVAASNLATPFSGPVSITIAAQQQVYVPPAPSVAASRYDLVTDQSRVAPGGTITGSLNLTSGTWNGSGNTATITAGSGGTVTVSLPSSGSAPVTYSVAAPNSAGAIYVTSTNTAGLRPGAPAPVTVFTPSSGSAAALTLGSPSYTQLPQHAVQKRAWAGAPTGWSGTNGVTLNQGWGRFKLPVGGSAPALFARLTDKDSSGASTAAGTGTPITVVAQVYGAVSGAQTVDIILPASDKCVYLDVATDAAFTSPVRFPVPFFVRDKCFIATRSQMNMLLGSYANGLPGNQSWSSYVMGSGIGAQNPDGGTAETSGAYVRIDGVQSYGNNGQPYGGVGAQEIGRLHALKTGAGYTIGGIVPAGGNLDQFWNQDGSPRSGGASIIEYLDREFRTAIIEGNGWSGVYASESATAYRALYANLTKWLLDNIPSLSTVAFCSATGLFGGDGSRALGYTRQNQWIEDLEAADPCIVSINTGADWNGYYSNSNHANWESAIRYARASERAVLLSSPTISGGYGLGHADRYVSVATTGTMAAGSGQIKIPIVFVAGATAIVAKKWNSYAASAAAMTASYTTPTAAELAVLWHVYQGAGGTQDSGAATVPVSGVTIDGNGNFVLAVPSSTAVPLTVQFLSDFSQLGDGSSWVGYFDNRDLGDQCDHGPGLRSRVDIAITAG